MLKDIQVTGQKDTRSGFGDGIVEVARKNSDVVALTADLAGSLKLGQFIKEFPERFFQCGIGEANMIGIGAGLTIGGKIPYTTTFANFSTGRVYDQIRQSVLQRKRSEAIQIYVTNLRDKMQKDGKIRMNDKELQRLSAATAGS